MVLLGGPDRCQGARCMHFALSIHCTAAEVVFCIIIRPDPLSAESTVACCCLSFSSNVFNICWNLLYVRFLFLSIVNFVIGGVFLVSVSRCLKRVRKGVGDCLIGIWKLFPYSISFYKRTATCKLPVEYVNTGEA